MRSRLCFSMNEFVFSDLPEVFSSAAVCCEPGMEDVCTLQLFVCIPEKRHLIVGGSRVRSALSVQQENQSRSADVRVY